MGDFCTKCGSALTEDARFCTGCGEPVAAPDPVVPDPVTPAASTSAPAPAAHVSSETENVISIIPNALCTSGFMGLKAKPYTLVITNRRIIFAFLTKELSRRAVTDARDGAKADGKGFMGQWGARLSAFSSFAERYLTLSPEQTLAEASENFAIERSTITKTKLKAGVITDTGSNPDKLIITTSDKKYKLMLNAGMAQAKQALIAADVI